MAVNAFEKGSKEWMMFSDYWGLCRKFWTVRDSGGYWDAVIRETSAFCKKYPDGVFARKLAQALLARLDGREGCPAGTSDMPGGGPGKGSEEWAVFADYWKLCREYWTPVGGDGYWGAAFAATAGFCKKHQGEPFARRLAFAFLAKLEENDKKKNQAERGTLQDGGQGTDPPPCRAITERGPYL